MTLPRHHGPVVVAATNVNATLTDGAAVSKYPAYQHMVFASVDNELATIDSNGDLSFINAPDAAPQLSITVSIPGEHRVYLASQWDGGEILPITDVPTPGTGAPVTVGPLAIPGAAGSLLALYIAGSTTGQVSWNTGSLTAVVTGDAPTPTPGLVPGVHNGLHNVHQREMIRLIITGITAKGLYLYRIETTNTQLNFPLTGASATPLDEACQRLVALGVVKDKALVGVFGRPKGMRWLEYTQISLEAV